MKNVNKQIKEGQLRGVKKPIVRPSCTQERWKALLRRGENSGF
jgi:hypothetical protein